MTDMPKTQCIWSTRSCGDASKRVYCKYYHPDNDRCGLGITTNTIMCCLQEL